ncbi:leukocyte immunoglobulin-like receptor subfamily B member 3A, partial [Nannospalax galili]|uniref:leukocyte immunoglobulin-like receptor subfamily B member 3A n=1 Tax=Nannospalax galili TaxID=1026970 RepID=UPI00111C880B
MQTLLEPGNKAKSSIPFLDWSHAGRYRCNYQTPAGWSEFSDPLELVVTGYHYSKPSLSAQYSPAVASGGNIVLQCVSGHQYDRFVLKKEEPQELSWTLTPQYTYSTGQYQALFSVGPVIPSQKWRLRCYGYDLWSPQLWSEPSDPLELQVSETHHKPTIRAEPSSVIASGSHVTIWCQGILNAQEYILQKEGSSAPWDTQIPMEPGDKAKFSISSMTEQYAGRYCCYYYSPAGWTQCSDALELVMTVHSKPQLSALPSPVASVQGLCSIPELPEESAHQRLGGYQMILIGVSVVFFLLFLLIFLLLRWRCQHKCRKEVQSEITDIQLPEDSEEPVPRERGPQKRSCPATAIKKEIKYASLKFPQPKSSMELYSLNPPNEDPLKEMYTKVKPSRLGRAGATSPPSTLS